MALIQGTSYDDVYWTNVLKKVQEIIIAEFSYGNVYIAPDIQTKASFSVRIWGTGASTLELWASAWHKTYSVSINMYMIEKNTSETFYKKFYAESERLYQLMYNNLQTSGTLGWWEGVVNDISYNELEADEEDIDGLQKAEFNFTCNVGRTS